ncbi:MAG: DUF3696 domain-containing protein [Candidatus Odinarchaeota archaeon]
MVDEGLIKELKGKIKKGAGAADVKDILKIFKLFKQISEKDEIIKGELEDMDIIIQMIITDAKAKFWLKIHDGNIEYGEGEVEKASFRFSSIKEVGVGIMFGEIDLNIAYMAGDITIEGDFQDAIVFQEIFELALEVYADELEISHQYEINYDSDFINFYNTKLYPETLSLTKNIVRRPLILKAIKSSNFKSFQSLYFNLKKINIILGPNNSGKSNFLKLLLLLKQTFTSPIKAALLLNGKILNFGSYKDITFNQNDDEISLDLIFKQFTCSFLYKYEKREKKIILRIFEIKDDQKKSILLSDIENNLIKLIGENHIKLIEEFNQKKAESIRYLNEIRDNIEDFQKKSELDIDIDMFIKTLKPFDFNLEIEQIGFIPEMKLTQKSQKVHRIFDMYAYLTISLEKIKYENIKQFISVSQDILKIMRKIIEIEEILTNLKSKLQKLFTKIYYLGPIRNYPERYYPVIGEVAGDVGSRGEYTPQLLKSIKERSQNKIYEEKIKIWFNEFEMARDISIKRYDDIPEYFSIMCKEFYSNVNVNLSNMGIGTSQILPIIIEGYLIEPKSILLVEQPEIHLHPKAQSTLGDLFIDIANENKTVIIETHSQYLFQRIQRRIAEGVISNKEVNFYYVSMTEEGSLIKPLNLDEFGYFESLPDGFFDRDHQDSVKKFNESLKKGKK